MSWHEVSGRGHSYAARFDRLAASGADVHGEASLVASLLPAGGRILDAGCGTGRVALRLTELGFDCVGVDVDPPMLEVARQRGPQLRWYESDLAALDLADEPPFDLVVAAGNVMPLLAAGTGPSVMSGLAATLVPGGLLVAGFGLDAAHLPIPEPTVDLPGYDGWCDAAGLVLEERLATWDGAPYDPAPDSPSSGYAVSIYRKTAPAPD
jgi:SAM-dependent methyltransferase